MLNGAPLKKSYWLVVKKEEINGSQLLGMTDSGVKVWCYLSRRSRPTSSWGGRSLEALVRFDVNSFRAL